LDDEIRSRIEAFAVDLAALVKRAAIEEIHAALAGVAGPAARRGAGRRRSPRGTARAGESDGPVVGHDGVPLSLEHYERMAIQRALAESGGDIRGAGERLGMSKSTIYRRMMILGIPRRAGADGADPPEFVQTDEPVSLDGYERLAIRRALQEADGDRIGAARLLSVGKSTLYRKLRRLGLD
jgi:transcriptional regulator of acetoin/glycerol metabolism